MKAAAVVTAAFGITAALGFAAAPAQAAGDTTCSSGDGSLCLYWYNNLGGSHVGVIGDVWNYDQDPNSCWSQGCNPYTFQTSGDGYGHNLRNNAQSYANETSTTFCVYYSPGYGGTYDVIPPRGYANWYGNLNYTWNNNASQRMC
jgi:hypothetical protein